MKQNEQPTVGVAIVSYFYGMFVAQAIDSVLSQSRLPDQIVVIDDASFDETISVAQKYNLDTVQRSQNMGTRKNFQDILNNIFWADYCMFLGADNWLHPDYIKCTLDTMLSNNSSIVSTDMVIVGEYKKDMENLVLSHTYKHDGYIVWSIGGFDKKNADKYGIHHGSSLFNREHCILSGGHYPIRNIMMQDRDCWLNMINNGYKATRVKAPLFYYRQHRFNFSKHRFGKNKI